MTAGDPGTVRGGRLLAAAVILLIGTDGIGCAQTMLPDVGAGQKFNVAIVNQTEQKIGFILRPKDGDWTNYELQSGEKSAYSCTGCGGDFEIKIRTDDKVISYSIKTGNLYGIRWNEEKRIFDIFVLQ
jgi:hypothetical protein